MKIKASLKHFRMSPRKVRLVANLIKSLDITEAQFQLKFAKKRAAPQILKLLNSAAANAKHNFNIDKENLYVKEIRVDEGVKLKRWEPRAFGRASPIFKRASHVTLVLEERPGRVKAQKINPVRKSPPHKLFGRANPVRSKTPEASVDTDWTSNGASAGAVSNGVKETKGISRESLKKEVKETAAKESLEIRKSEVKAPFREKPKSRFKADSELGQKRFGVMRKIFQRKSI